MKWFYYQARNKPEYYCQVVLFTVVMYFWKAVAHYYKSEFKGIDCEYKYRYARMQLAEIKR